MEVNKLTRLIARYNSGAATDEEKLLLEAWYDSVQGDDAKLDEAHIAAVRQQLHGSLQSYIRQNNAPAKGSGLMRILAPYYKWAAAAVLLFGFIIFLYQHGDKQQLVVKYKPTTLLKNDITPGGTQAILILANGSRIVLDNAHKGQLAMQGQTQVSKKNDGLLAYQSSSTAPVSQVLYNTVSTPRGGQFEVALPDGTKVWLNAASSLRFPTAFIGKERDVELTGEAYFEVTKNKDLPFHVTSAGQVIEVLGTHFNINAYTDEKSIKTTLFEGSVRVVKNLKSAILKPGEQSIVSNDEANTISIADNVDADEVLAWKNGKFYFNNADVETVMRQVSRWYDVDIEYKGKSSADRFTGNFTRDLNLSKTLKLLEFTGINFKIEGRKIIVQ